MLGEFLFLTLYMALVMAATVLALALMMGLFYAVAFLWAVVTDPVTRAAFVEGIAEGFRAFGRGVVTAVRYPIAAVIVAVEYTAKAIAWPFRKVAHLFSSDEDKVDVVSREPSMTGMAVATA